MPDSVEIIPADTGRAEWLTARRAGLGGSDASTVAGVNPYSTLYELWLDKTGRGFEKEDTPEMRFGRLIEDDARQVFTEDTGIDVTLSGMHQSTARPWQLYTPDGFTSDGGLLEVKSVGWREAHKWVDGQVADHAEVQVQHGMAVTGAGHAWVVAEIERHFHFTRVERDPTFIELLIEMELDFWERHVLADEEPSFVGADLDAVKAQHPEAADGGVAVVDPDWLASVLADRAAAAAAVTAAKTEKDRLDAVLVAAIGDSEAVTASDDTGQPLIYATRKNYTSHRLNQTRLRKDHPDTWDEYATTVTTRRLHVLTKPRKEYL